MSFHGIHMMHNALTKLKCLLHQRVGYAVDAMNDPATRLKEAREAAGFGSASEAAEAMGMKVPTYVQHENGTRGYPKAKAERYAAFFRTTPEWLLYGRGKPHLEKSNMGPQIPLIGSVAAGVWNETSDYDGHHEVTFTGRSDIAVPLAERFGLKVVGDSMNLQFPPGTILECVTFWGNSPLENGKFVIVQRRRKDGSTETTVKEYMRDPGGIEWLVPRSTNPAFQAPFRCDQPGDDIEDIRVIATVVASTQFW